MGSEEVRHSVVFLERYMKTPIPTPPLSPFLPQLGVIVRESVGERCGEG